MRIVVCGVGNRMKGDDGIGPAVIDELRKEVGGKWFDSEDVLLLDCGTAPENFIGKITWFDPGKVVIVDAVDMGREPGLVDVIDSGQIIGNRISTHSLPLNVFVQYLKDAFRNSLDIIFIGAQPNARGFGEPLSDSGRRAVEQIKRKVLSMVLKT